MEEVGGARLDCMVAVVCVSNIIEGVDGIEGSARAASPGISGGGRSREVDPSPKAPLESSEFLRKSFLRPNFPREAGSAEPAPNSMTSSATKYEKKTIKILEGEVLRQQKFITRH